MDRRRHAERAGELCRESTGRPRQAGHPGPVTQRSNRRIGDMSTRSKKAPVLVVLQLSGGNDFMNTVVPYTNGHYYDNRKTLVVREDEALPIDGELGLHPMAVPLKEMYDQ